MTNLSSDMSARVVLTGASQGIGKAILLALARSGHSVLGLSRTKPTEADSPEFNNVAWKRLDLSDTADVATCTASLEALPIRTLILSAVDYGGDQRHPTADTSAQEWERVVGTNCVGQCFLVSCLLPKLIKHSPGILINVSSDVALLPGSGRAAYAASKAGLHAMVRAVAAEYDPECLRVFQLVPTFQSITAGIRRRRPADFDFSSYVDPAVIATLVTQLLSSSGTSHTSGTYLLRRDGSIEQYSETTHL
jgi:cyclitol oxidoreductase